MSAALASPIDFPESHLIGGAQRRPALGGTTSPDPAIDGPQPTPPTPGMVNPTPEQADAVAPPIPNPPVRATLPPAPANVCALPNLQPPVLAEPDDRQAAASERSEPKGSPLRLADPVLSIAADVLDDLERVRIGNENRLRQLTRDEIDDDGETRGLGLPLDHGDVARLAALVDGLAHAEHQATLNLGRIMRNHPLGPWVKQAKGVGEKQGARLLAAIGDPYWNDLHNRPRTVSELWSYCGYHVLRTGHAFGDTHAPAAGSAPLGSNPDHIAPDTQRVCVGVAAARARGQRANWSASAKMRAHLVATSIVKAGGPYRDVYDAGRAKCTDATHQVECKRCGPSGKPAAIGTPLSAGHQHARALRLVAKEVLKDLWREAKRLHEEAAP